MKTAGTDFALHLQLEVGKQGVEILGLIFGQAVQNRAAPNKPFLKGGGVGKVAVFKRGEGLGRRGQFMKRGGEFRPLGG